MFCNYSRILVSTIIVKRGNLQPSKLLSSKGFTLACAKSEAYITIKCFAVRYKLKFEIQFVYNPL